MNEGMTVQGRHLMPEDIKRIRRMIAENPLWSRWRISKALCAEWNWRNGSGQLKDMAARSLLGKLNDRSLIQLPPRRRVTPNRMALQSPHRVTWDETPVTPP